MGDPLKRHKYAVNRILIPAARILSPEFNAAYLYFTGAHIELMRNLLDYANRETTFVDEYHDGYYYSPSDADINLINIVVAELELMLMTTVLGYYDAYVCVRHTGSVGTNGGTFTSGAWRTRYINDEHADEQGICSIGSNQITLQAGTYRILATAQAYSVQHNQMRLYNITDSAEMLVGIIGYAYPVGSGHSLVSMVGRFTLATQKTLELQHRCAYTQANNGMGIPGSFGTEVYATAEFWRET